MAYCSQTDLELAVGGSATLVQLLDKDGDGVADSAFVTLTLSRATAEVKSAIQVSVDLSGVESSPPDVLKYVTATIAAYYAFLSGSDGMGVPQRIVDSYQDALRWLDQIARRERTLGSSTRETGDQDITQVDTDSDLTGVSRNSLKGFW